MIKRLLYRQSNTITSAAVVIGAAAFISRILGIFRDRILAGEFGAGIELDIYYTAFRLPDLMFNLIVLGAISAGFIPVFTEYLKNKKKAWELANTVVNTLSITLILSATLTSVLAPWLVRIIAPGFDFEQTAIATRLTRIMLLSPIFLGISGVIGGILQSTKQFFAYSLAPIFYNIGIIFGALVLSRTYGLEGLAWGVVLGACMHLCIQLPTSFMLGYRYRLVLNITDKGFRKIIRMMAPRILTLLTSQFNFFIVTIIGSTLAAGSIAVYNLANNLQSFPLGLFGISFAIAAFPTLSLLKDNKKKFVDTLSQSIRQILFFIVPAAGLLIVLRAQIVRVLLGTGLFDWQDTLATLDTLTAFAVSLFAQAIVLLLIRAFYALEDSKTPFYAGIISALSNIILSVVLIDFMGVVGLALAFSLSNILYLVMLWILLHNKVGNLGSRLIISTASKVLAATFVMALTAQAMKFVIEQYTGTQTFLGITAQGLGALAIAIITYFSLCHLMRVEELHLFLESLRKKLYKKTKVTPPLEALEND